MKLQLCKLKNAFNKGTWGENYPGFSCNYNKTFSFYLKKFLDLVIL